MLKTIVEEMTGMFAFLQETKIRFNFHLMYDIREDVDGVVQVGSLQWLEAYFFQLGCHLLDFALNVFSDRFELGIDVVGEVFDDVAGESVELRLGFVHFSSKVTDCFQLFLRVKLLMLKN